ncbi:MAG: type II toxin-antitoxin system VapC family toxin [Bacteroidetes bacterium]|nr:type II toxin-antitoxin system VapC family toxin [Bacteroidota bacterium]
MRYYLDTNILVFILLNQRDEIDKNVEAILEDYSNSFYVSTVVVRELILLHKNGELQKQKYKTYKDIFDTIEELNYEIKPIQKEHLFAYATLNPALEHKDPNDHTIIAQAISDKIPVISSDRKFKLYETQNLKLVFNKR